MGVRRFLLVAPPDDFLSGYDAGEHLSGVMAPSYRLGGPSGRPLSGRPLDRALYALGIGAKVVTAEGVYQPAGVPPLEHLPRWERTTRLAGSLDAGTLGRILHELVRRFRDAEAAAMLKQGLTDTPPLIFLQRIHIRTEPGATPERRTAQVKDKRTGKLRPAVVRRRVYYVDTVTGQRVKESTWRRSRAAIRANTPKGQRPKPGRYARRVSESRK